VFNKHSHLKCVTRHTWQFALVSEHVACQAEEPITDHWWPWLSFSCHHTRAHDVWGRL